MPIITVFNQKGGVGRTTTALNLLAAIARRGERPLGIDLDPQAHLSQAFGVHARASGGTMYSFFTEQQSIEDIAAVTRSGVLLCPAHLDLAKLDAILGKGINVLTRLGRALREDAELTDPVVIDTGPLFNVLTLNAVFACDLLIIPVACDFLSLRAAREVERALKALEPVLKRRLPRRYLITRCDTDSRMADTVIGRMAEALPPEEICATRIRECTELAESPTVGLDVFRHAPGSQGAQDYKALAEELANAGFLPARRQEMDLDAPDQKDFGPGW